MLRKIHLDSAEVYESETHEVQEISPVEESTATKIKRTQGKSGSKKDILTENCPVDVVEHRLSAEELLCKVCGTEMVEIGKEIHRSFKIIPVQVLLQEDWYYTYAFKRCEKEKI